MTALVPIMLFGWIPVVFMFFAALPPRRAVITAFLSAWMFLPIYGYDLPGLPAYNKMSATCAGIFLAAAVYDFKSLRGFRLRWFDLPMLAWCLSPMPSSIFNGIGVYEGLSGVQYEFVSWGMPYLIGRLYFGTIEALVDLAIGIFIGGLVYIPLVLIEMRFSPQLHTWVYGFHQHVFAQAKKAGGWRPTVFMQHGLAVANFMGGAAVIGLALWYTQRLRRWKGLPMWLLVLVLWVVFALCRSSGALVLAVFGGAMLLAAWKLKTRVPIYAAMALPILYMVARTVGGWNGHEVVDIARYFADEKADSVLSRLHSETGLWHEVQGRLIFGAGRFGWAGEVVDGYKIIPDGLWIIALGKRGFVGLIAITLALLTPAWLFVRRWPTFTWTHPLVGPAASMAVLLVMYMADNLSNAMLNPIFMLGAGGLPMVSEHALALARQPRGGPRATAGRPVGAAAMRPAAGVAPARPAPGAARA